MLRTVGRVDRAVISGAVRRAAGPGGLLTVAAAVCVGLSAVSMWWALPAATAAFFAGREPGRTGPTVLVLVAVVAGGVVAVALVPSWLLMAGRFVELVRRHRPAVAVLDIRMPGMNGIEAAAEIRRTVPETGVVMLTTFGEDDYILQALGGGAAGFLIKSGEPEELIAGVRAVADGAAYLSPKVAARVVAHLSATGAGALAGRRTAARERVRGLTARERDVLALLGSGLSNGQIARRLHVVEGTVKAHVSSILARLGVDNRAAAAVVAHEAGIVAPAQPPPDR
ncbi:response regulator [Streptomyces sp. NPDC058092]|uniref:response regulator n=1 Tax=Streptomyces sp. NPDC058092 TaxID=3346336 RepID=UPI0036E38EA5